MAPQRTVPQSGRPPDFCVACTLPPSTGPTASKTGDTAGPNSASMPKWPLSSRKR